MGGLVKWPNRLRWLAHGLLNCWPNRWRWLAHGLLNCWPNRLRWLAHGVAELLAQPLALVGSRGWFAGAFWGKLHRKPRLRLLP